MESRLVDNNCPTVPGRFVFSAESEVVSETEVTGSTDRLRFHQNIAQPGLSVTSDSDFGQLPVLRIGLAHPVHFTDISFANPVLPLIASDFNKFAVTDQKSDRADDFREKDCAIYDNPSVDRFLDRISRDFPWPGHPCPGSEGEIGSARCNNANEGSLRKFSAETGQEMRDLRGIRCKKAHKILQRNDRVEKDR